MTEPKRIPQETATLGGGCFWCVEAALRQLDGAESIISGYSGGAIPNPDYESVCGGKTGHAEVVQIHFDPTRLDYRTLLQAFFAIHDPTTLNRQGNDVGTQYRSVIQFHSETQARIAKDLISELETAKTWPSPVVTEIIPAEFFWPAEEYHQDYFARNPQQSYCQFVVGPKAQKLRALFRDRLKK
ncbi:MAG TPA: peptide-methionine (S)-S-oxide reductase MsrA [Rhodocyclaceae bacterium]|jgi:peptide-methionine (S)-S-oxide reductase